MPGCINNGLALKDRWLPGKPMAEPASPPRSTPWSLFIFNIIGAALLLWLAYYAWAIHGRQPDAPLITSDLRNELNKAITERDAIQKQLEAAQYQLNPRSRPPEPYPAGEIFLHRFTTDQARKMSNALDDLGDAASPVKNIKLPKLFTPFADSRPGDILRRDGFDGTISELKSFYEQIDALQNGIEEAVKKKATSENDLRRVLGNTGLFQLRLEVGSVISALRELQRENISTGPIFDSFFASAAQKAAPPLRDYSAWAATFMSKRYPEATKELEKKTDH